MRTDEEDAEKEKKNQKKAGSVGHRTGVLWHAASERAYQPDIDRPTT
jgi:hypothetical protein